MRIRKIRTKLLLGIVPFILLSMVILTLISANSSEQTIDEQITTSMGAELKANINDINSYLDVVRSTAMNLSRTVGATYKTTEMDDYDAVFEKIIWDNDLVLGSGIWFEPRVYDAEEKYMGPYWYKDGNSTVLTYDYSNAEYDYFVQEYYTLAKESNGEAIITDPYYDPTLDIIMASCTAPIYDVVSGRFIGCVTVDIALDSIDKMVGAIQVGKEGIAILTTENGTYLHCEDKTKVVDGRRCHVKRDKSIPALRCLFSDGFAPDISTGAVCAAVFGVVFCADGTVVQIGLNGFGEVLVSGVHQNAAQFGVRPDIGQDDIVAQVLRELYYIIQTIDAFRIQGSGEDVPLPVIHLTDRISQFIQLFHLFGIVDIGTEDILPKGGNGTVHPCDSHGGEVNTDSFKPGERFAYLCGGSRQVKVDPLICAFIGELQSYHAMPPI